MKPGPRQIVLPTVHHDPAITADWSRMQRAAGRKDDFQTDALRPAALPTASLRPRAGEEQTTSQTSEEYLDAMYEDWNKKVDVEIETLVEGMAELVQIASIGTKDKYRVAQEAFQAQCRTESMVRAATSLLAITHSLKLLLLLSDEHEIAVRRDAESVKLTERMEASRRMAVERLDGLLNSLSREKGDMELDVE